MSDEREKLDTTDPEQVAEDDDFEGHSLQIEASDLGNVDVGNADVGNIDVGNADVGNVDVG